MKTTNSTRSRTKISGSFAKRASIRSLSSVCFFSFLSFSLLGFVVSLMLLLTPAVSNQAIIVKSATTPTVESCWNFNVVGYKDEVHSKSPTSTSTESPKKADSGDKKNKKLECKKAPEQKFSPGDTDVLIKSFCKFDERYLKEDDKGRKYGSIVWNPLHIHNVIARMKKADVEECQDKKLDLESDKDQRKPCKKELEEDCQWLYVCLPFWPPSLLQH